MQDILKEQPKRGLEISELPRDDKDRLVGFFALLIKVDRRVNPDFYKPKTKIQ